ncbi:protein-cysteine N-palmitoyltransferase HHAT-like protein isoform X1 [Kogia breviceps]|uniref:protein-cysteine N-palmitoyltransferase HHAT-like protein isoform X1 n=1 Tax=Kogia breviceps TaxID=27615 RepID=UPI0034D34EFC
MGRMPTVAAQESWFRNCPIQAMGIKTALPAAELGLYSLVLSGALAYAGRGLLEASQGGAHRKAFRESVQPGWEYIGRKMDVADFEWVMWFTSFRNAIFFALSGHVLFAKLCTMVAPQLRSWMYAVYGALAVVGTMGPWYLLLLLGHCVGLYVVSLLRQPWLCLGLGLASLASFKLDPLISWQSGFVTGTFDLQEVLFHGGSGFTVLRCTSFALESCAHPDRRYSLADLLKYNFYLPFFFFGPIMTFDRFHAQVSQVEPVRREGELWHIRAQAGLSVVAIVAVDIFFHFFYILTIPSDLKFASRLPDSALAGLAYSNLVYDWVKAAVLFGVVNTVARLDHLDPPRPPKCITALYVFAETHFDRGINDWLCRYVYDHIGGEHTAVIPELAATVATFAITTLWLGPCDTVYLWSCLNCFGLNFELWVQKLAEWGPLARIEQASLSEQMSRRVRAIFGAMNFWAIIMYNLVSLNSFEFTELVAQRLLLTGEGRGIRNVPGINLKDCDLLKCLQPTAIPQGLSREGQSSGERRVTGGKGSCFQEPMTSSPHRVPPYHAGRPVCHLLRCPAGEGARANPDAGGGAEQREARVGEMGGGLGSAQLFLGEA